MLYFSFYIGDTAFAVTWTEDCSHDMQAGFISQDMGKQQMQGSRNMLAINGDW
jgi:hypothetical protein